MTDNGLGGQLIQPWCRRHFPHQSKPARGPGILLYKCNGYFFPDIQRPAQGLDNPPRQKPRLKKNSCFSVPPLGLNFRL
jgi:hypothetical protein